MKRIHALLFKFLLAIIILVIYQSSSYAFIGIEDTIQLNTNSQNVEAALPDDIANRPSYEYYQLWDTHDIHPYEFDIRSFHDTIELCLLDSLDCGFAMPIIGPVTSNFGFRNYRYHYGIDLDLNTGDTVVSAFDGVVRIAQYSTTYGNVVVIRHYNGLETFYAHLSKLLVKPGDALTAGVPIALGGSTGHSTGSHLHFEVRFKGWPINPNDLISFKDDALNTPELMLTRSNFKYLIDAKSAVYYTVHTGDSLSRIASKYGTNISRLCSLNHISSKSIIRPGQRLRVR